METRPELPDDVESLKSLVATHLQTITRQSEEIARLEHNTQVLRKMIFGPKSEKRPPTGPDALQGSLFLQELKAQASRLAARHGVEATVKVAAHVRAKKKGRRSEFPEHLPVVQTLSELKADERTCACGGQLTQFGEEVSRELERVETTVVHEMVRKKYACERCKQGVVTAPWRGKVIDKGLLGPGFLSHVIVERFGNHLPYFRLERQYRDEGLDLSRSVLCESMARCAELLEPVASQVRKEILASPIINTDDTPVTLAQSSEGGSKKARVWVYLDQTGRHWYDFTESRKRDGPARVFADYTGYIQADAYGGYDRRGDRGGLLVPRSQGLHQGRDHRPRAVEAGHRPDRQAVSDRGGGGSSVAGGSPADAPAGGRTPGRGISRVAGVDRDAGAAQRPHGTGDHLRAEPVGSSDPVPEGRSARDDEQRRGARRQAVCDREEELALLPARGWRQDGIGVDEPADDGQGRRHPSG
jgi:transposase